MDEPHTDLVHLRREIRTALELSVVALAPWKLIDQLAAGAGLLEALLELPTTSSPVVAIVPKAVARANASLRAWRAWHKDHLEAKLARG